MIKMGTVIGDRYEVLEKIGTGGMSDVYRAKDEKLSRMVAVKILKQEFSENENFVQKFRTEAQAAAGLAHPNIVNVYDVGDEKGIYYIVMELVDGITLKRYIQEKNRLTVREAVSISIQVAMGLEAAHAGGIIHRDIKPQNIIISKEGKVKVTDFGIAKAATSNTITSNVMGSVHYTSPEQARGGYSDAMSDIYSLGVTMFEMLTGRVPFNGDTTVAIAIKHIQEPIQSPRAFVPDVPVSVEKIVLKCCQKSPDRRYQTAAALIADLKQSLITPDEDFVRLTDPDAEGATRPASEEELREVKERTGGAAAPVPKKKASSAQGTPSKNGTRGKAPARKPSQSAAKGKRRNDDYYENDSRAGQGIERMTMVSALVIAILVIIILFFAIGSVFGIFAPGNTNSSASTVTATQAPTTGTPVEETETGIVIPEVTGNSYAEAKSTLEAKGFTVSKQADADNIAPRNTVTGQSPAGNERAPSGTEVVLTVSDGTNTPVTSTPEPDPASTGDDATTQDDATTEDSTVRMVAVPELYGKTHDEAKALLISAGLVGSDTPERIHNEAPEGTVFRQSPVPGTMVESGTEVGMEISLGPVKYMFNGQVEAPPSDRYVPGMEVEVTFTTGDGTVLLQTATTTFPLAVSVDNLTSATGSVIWKFTDPETGEMVDPIPSLSVDFAEME